MLNMIEVKGLLEFLFKIEIIELLKIIPLISISFFFILSILQSYLFYILISTENMLNLHFNPSLIQHNYFSILNSFNSNNSFHPSITLDNAPRILNEIHFLNWNLRKPVLLLENLFSNRRH